MKKSYVQCEHPWKLHENHFHIYETLSFDSLSDWIQSMNDKNDTWNFNTLKDYVSKYPI